MEDLSAGDEEVGGSVEDEDAEAIEVSRLGGIFGLKMRLGRTTMGGWFEEEGCILEEVDEEGCPGVVRDKVNAAEVNRLKSRGPLNN